MSIQVGDVCAYPLRNGSKIIFVVDNVSGHWVDVHRYGDAKDTTDVHREKLKPYRHAERWAALVAKRKARPIRVGDRVRIVATEGFCDMTIGLLGEVLTVCSNGNTGVAIDGYGYRVGYLTDVERI